MLPRKDRVTKPRSTKALAVPAALLLALSPALPASAQFIYNDAFNYCGNPILPGDVVDERELDVCGSTPVLQQTKAVRVILAQGDTVSASLEWLATGPAGAGAAANDLDLRVVLPGFGEGSLDSLQTKILPILSCGSIAASSAQHLGGSREAVDYTVPPGGEQGAYLLLVSAWYLDSAQGYTLSVAVRAEDGRDVTASRVQPIPGQAAHLVANPHCQVGSEDPCLQGYGGAGPGADLIGPCCPPFCGPMPFPAPCPPFCWPPFPPCPPWCDPGPPFPLPCPPGCWVQLPAASPLCPPDCPWELPLLGGLPLSAAEPLSRLLQPEEPPYCPGSSTTWC